MGKLQLAQDTLDQIGADIGVNVPRDSREAFAYYSILGRVALARDDVPRALAALTSALEGYEAHDIRWGARVTVLCARAEAYVRAGNLAAARADANAAMTTARELQADRPVSIFTGYSLMALSFVQRKAGDEAGAARSARQAHRHFEAMLGPEHPDTRAAERAAIGKPAQMNAA
jgi:hypothetical protein